MRRLIIPQTKYGLIVRIALLLLLVALIAYEVVARQVTPDAMQYSVTQTTDGVTDFSLSGTVTDPVAVAHYRAAMTATPSGKYIWQGALRSLLAAIISPSARPVKRLRLVKNGVRHTSHYCAESATRYIVIVDVKRRSILKARQIISFVTGVGDCHRL